MAKGDAEAQNGITRLRVLYGAAIDASKSTDTRRRAINTLKKEYPDYFSKLSNEEIMLGKAAKRLRPAHEQHPEVVARQGIHEVPR